MEKRYECYHCSDCPTEEEWNEHNRVAFSVLGGIPLPEGLNGGTYDCPSCGEFICGEDLTKV